MRTKRAGNPWQKLLKQVTGSRQVTVGLILVVALFAFEMFNFDTTQYALRSLLGDVRFLGIGWATILAIAFCAIDFAGLARLFTPERGADEPKEVWYLMGAWLLGAAMNAVMTWWAVSLTLLNHPFGNEVLSREVLLRSVPIFVAVLVWLTRILFIGSLTVAGEKFLYGEEYKPRKSYNNSRSTSSSRGRTATASASARTRRAVPKPRSQPAPVTGAPAEEYVPYYATSANNDRQMGDRGQRRKAQPRMTESPNRPVAAPNPRQDRPHNPIRPASVRNRAPRPSYGTPARKAYYSSSQKPKTLGRNLD